MGLSFADSALDIFNDDVESLSDSRRKRPRTSWGGHSRWKLTDRVPSPDKPEADAFAPDNAELDDLAIEELVPLSTPLTQDMEPTPSASATAIDETPLRFRPYRDPIPTASFARSTSKLSEFEGIQSRPSMSIFNKPSSIQRASKISSTHKSRETVDETLVQDSSFRSENSTNSESQTLANAPVDTGIRSKLMGPPLVTSHNPQTPQLLPLTPSAG